MAGIPIVFEAIQCWIGGRFSLVRLTSSPRRVRLMRSRAQGLPHWLSWTRERVELKDLDRLPKLASELVSLNVDVIVTDSNAGQPGGKGGDNDHLCRHGGGRGSCTQRACDKHGSRRA
jgi:hypothetical protein